MPFVERSRSTATTYYLVVDEPRRCGWATCTVNDTTGELAIQSDWTDPCGYRWPVAHLGCPTLTDFLASAREDYEYLVGKLLPSERRETFSPDETVKAMRQRVIAGRRDGDLSRPEARELWDGLGDLVHHSDSSAFFANLDETSYRSWFDDVFEDRRDVPSHEARALSDHILPELAKSCAAEVQRRKETPPPVDLLAAERAAHEDTRGALALARSDLDSVSKRIGLVRGELAQVKTAWEADLAAIASRLGCDDHRVDILQAIDELLERGNR